MVVWLKPCKSRSSPGALSERLPSNRKAFAFAPGASCNRSSPGALSERLSSNGKAFAFAPRRELQQVVARGFIRTPSQQWEGVRFCALARAATGHRQGLYQNAFPATGRRSLLRLGASCNRSSPGGLSRKSWLRSSAHRSRFDKWILCNVMLPVAPRAVERSRPYRTDFRNISMNPLSCQQPLPSMLIAVLLALSRPVNAARNPRTRAIAKPTLASFSVRAMRLGRFRPRSRVARHARVRDEDRDLRQTQTHARESRGHHGQSRDAASICNCCGWPAPMRIRSEEKSAKNTIWFNVRLAATGASADILGAGAA